MQTGKQSKKQTVWDTMRDWSNHAEIKKVPGNSNCEEAARLVIKSHFHLLYPSLCPGRRHLCVSWGSPSPSGSRMLSVKGRHWHVIGGKKETNLGIFFFFLASWLSLARLSWQWWCNSTFRDGALFWWPFQTVTMTAIARALPEFW